MATDIVKTEPVAHYPHFASYATWTDRIIPVVILEPAG